MKTTTPKQCDAVGEISGPRSKTDRQVAADRKKAERRLAREIEQRESDDRFTPPQLIRAVEDSFGGIDFDPCWHEASAVRPKAYLDVRRGHNGLRNEWSGPLAFVNPPWSAQDRWVRRAHDQWLSGNVDTVVCLVPAKTDARFFHDTLAKDADVYFLEGRPRFFKEDGSSEATMVSVMVVMLGATDQQKGRFAERVRGSWWLPGRASSVRIGKARAASLAVTHYYDAASCASLHEDACKTVICTPFASTPHMARF